MRIAIVLSRNCRNIAFISQKTHGNAAPDCHLADRRLNSAQWTPNYSTIFTQAAGNMWLIVQLLIFNEIKEPRTSLTFS